MKRRPNATHDFSISASVFSFFPFLPPSLFCFFTSLLGPELLTSGSESWCFLAAVKFRRSQPSGADTFPFFFFFVITQIFMHGPSASMTRLWPRHSPSRRRTPTSARRGSCAETITNPTTARGANATPPFDTWSEGVSFTDKNKTLQKAQLVVIEYFICK